MPDDATGFWLIIGFGFVLIAGSRLGAGESTFLAGLFPAHGVRDWPTGVQEGDAPRFAVDHLDGLRPGVPGPVDRVAEPGFDDPGDPGPEIVELGSRRLPPPLG